MIARLLTWWGRHPVHNHAEGEKCTDECVASHLWVPVVIPPPPGVFR
jgi:hypothetical protein